MKCCIVRIVVIAGLCAGLAPAALAVNRSFTLMSTPVTGITFNLTVDGGTPIEVVSNFSESYPNETAISVVAPTRALNRDFVGWEAFGVLVSTNPQFDLELGIDFTLVAVYGPPSYILQVTSSPDVGIEFRNEDIYYFTTPYEREFETEEPYEAIIWAPLTHNGRPFARWLVNGEQVSTFHVLNLMVDDDYQVEAQYGEGSITCKIQPKSARKKARWRINGGEWMKRGTTVTDLPVGDYLIEWKPVDGYQKPNNRIVPLGPDQALIIRGRYHPLK